MLAVCSCTVLPLFAGIYGMGAGIGPATAFLYSGPAINALAIILTARVLGIEIGIARAVGAVVFSVVIGLLMHLVFRRDARETALAQAAMPEEVTRPLAQTGLTFLAMVMILVFANWGSGGTGFFAAVFRIKWWLTGLGGLGLGATLVAWYGLPWWKTVPVAAAAAAGALLRPEQPAVAFTAATVTFTWAVSREGGELGDWFAASWGFAKQILPLLLAGVLVAGLLLGRPDHEGLLPSGWIAGLVGGNSIGANLFAAVSGAFMYFATLTEVPILEGLLGSGMGQGPALSLAAGGAGRVAAEHPGAAHDHGLEAHRRVHPAGCGALGRDRFHLRVGRLTTTAQVTSWKSAFWAPVAPNATSWKRKPAAPPSS